MGYSTDFLGHIEITPPLNPAEVEYLTAFSESRRWDRPGGPYEVPDNPRDDAVVLGEPDPETGAPNVRGPISEGAGTERFNRPARGQPQLRCQWVPCPDGCCLSDDGHEKFYEPTVWMRYLIDHFMKPGATASRSGLPCFESFTFDHELNGVIAACRRDTRRLWVIRVTRNRVTEKDLAPGVPESVVWGLFPYEREIDRLDELRRRRRIATVGPVVRL
ncbi:MAG TPA: hypothetical protein VFD41_08095 [Actinomycetales bacterium]|nr:hypothetical protein [Actinomycetales bacterium]